MRICERGVLNCGEPGTRRAISTFPTVAPLADGTLLATYRVGTAKDSADGTVELRRSHDGGRTWSDPDSPFDTTLNGTRGSLELTYITPLAEKHLIAAALWVDREAYPGSLLFNDQTEGCLPMAILLSDSHDSGSTWTPWRELPLPEEVGPPSLTNPLLRLPSGRLAASVETNKSYEDASPWLQKVVYAYSDDGGQAWGSPITVCADPSGRIFNWDQRAGVCPDGQLVTFTWTFDRESNRYCNIQRRLSADEGATWADVVLTGGGLTLVSTGPPTAQSGTSINEPADLLTNQAGVAAFGNSLLEQSKPFSRVIDLFNGNTNAWIANNTTPTDPFIGVDLNGLFGVGQIAFGRSNALQDECGGPCTDRDLGLYTLQVTTLANPDETTPDGSWTTIGTLDYQGDNGTGTGVEFGPAHHRHLYSITPVNATGLRLRVPLGAAIDEFEIFEGEAGPPSTATIFTWNLPGLGSWNNTVNWDPVDGQPNSRDHTALFRGAISTSSTVVVDAPVTVNRVEFDNASHSYIVAGAESVSFEANSQSDLPTMQVKAGSHQFQAVVSLLDATTVDVASGGTLEFNNRLFLNNNELTKTGAGEMAVNNILSAGGGTLICGEGLCSGSGTIGGDVNNSGGTISPGNSSGLMAIEGDFTQVTAVPEPASLVFLLIGAIGLTLVGGGRQRIAFRLSR